MNNKEFITAKFGGYPNANSGQIKKMADNLKSHSNAQFIVVSAPGRQNKDDIKVTDLLIEIADRVEKNFNWMDWWQKVSNRFECIISELGLESDLYFSLQNMKAQIAENPYRDFILSRGEYFQARIVASYLKAQFIDATDCIFFNEEGEVDERKTMSAIKTLTSQKQTYVFPGFYGLGADGKVKTFSRGGSDLTGAIVAVATNSYVYENWTDVNGFFTANPSEVKDARVIEMMNPTEARVLSYHGASILHEKTMVYLKKNNITLHIRNVDNPKGDGTKIIPAYNIKTDGIVGVIGKKDCVVITIETMGAHNITNFAAKFYKVIADCGISFDDELPGTDESGVAISNKEFDNCSIESLSEKIQMEVNPDKISVYKNVGIINTICYTQNSYFDVQLELSRNGIEIYDAIRIRSGQVVITIHEDNVQKAIEVIHKRFFH